MDLLSLSTLEIRQICYFLMIVKCDNSFSRAAEQLHIERPPLSQRIRALEKRLNVELFDRRQRPLRLTPAGRVFWERAQQALEQMDQAIAQTQRAAKGEIGHLTVGLSSSAANGLFSELLRRFCDRYPSVTIALQELTVEQQLSAIESGQIDIGFEVISPLQLSDRGLEWQVVDEESLVVVLPEAHPLAAETTVALTALAPESLILPNLQAFPFYQTFLDRCALAGFQPRLVENTTATWMLTILSLVVAGVGLAILPSNVLNLQRKGVVYREISGLDLVRQMLAVWRSDSNSATLHRLLLLLKET
ncbi:MAG: LysR family transcriptional regulator [Leptolyngbya sp. DLM2.Bin27]|nr:MAG: LysR family transcriptional regulator [Leptolyngbya sp. DLM2.Bin27]